jgi:hypothetical protein
MKTPVTIFVKLHHLLRHYPSLCWLPPSSVRFFGQNRHRRPPARALRKTKSPSFAGLLVLYRGDGGARTHVDGFAEPCLPRPNWGHQLLPRSTITARSKDNVVVAFNLMAAQEPQIVVCYSAGATPDNKVCFHAALWQICSMPLTADSGLL